MSDYTKTGKKVKCINSKRIDLTYKKVYDIFIDVDGEEFVIDESGDWLICLLGLLYSFFIFLGSTTSATTGL